MLLPGKPFPGVDIPLLGGGRWRLHTARHELSLISVIRGHFCTYCHDNVVDLDRRNSDFDAIGIDVVVTSTDDAQAAQTMVRDLDVRHIPVGFGLSEPDIRRLGLFATERAGAIFAEPAIILAKRSGEVYAVFQNSISCGKTDIDRLLEGLSLLAPAGYPLRGNA
ncbi:hypothetical protein Sphch_3304 [Sphingobium chlorophenolicum L-1]|uniref:Thioredoxin domain-containing protein n=1 Tax=Sphingobium chlorophenolicum L-1 TaxID=690566 RepID=F6F391_SPHCR|nr:redoxin domain-containing protein [Sphingobium chlorophenolicum]AEG50903.1 hypothetical protein Sphch_3304 [Sphingobium chlorophenolicum L-1]